MNESPGPAAESDLLAAADGLRHLALTMEQVRRRYGAVTGVGETDLMALGNLAAAGPMSPLDLSRRLGVTPPSVTTLVDRLEAAGLVARQAHPTDRRRLRIALTAGGEEAVRDARSWSLDALNVLEPDRLPVVAEVLDDLADALEERHLGTSPATGRSGPRRNAGGRSPAEGAKAG